jgi:hypothetical protein
MKDYKSKYGIITNSNLLIYQLNYQSISLNAINRIEIIEKKSPLNYIFNLFEKDTYDFTIVLDNEQEIKFSFNKKNLNQATVFKNKILHSKFCLNDQLLEK